MSCEPDASVKAPSFVNVGASVELHVVVVARAVLPESSVSWGSVRTPVTPNVDRAGPSPRTRICFCPVPVVTKPAISWLAPGSASARAERFTSHAFVDTARVPAPAEVVPALLVTVTA